MGKMGGKKSTTVTLSEFLRSIPDILNEKAKNQEDGASAQNRQCHQQDIAPQNQQDGVPENQQHGVPQNQEHGVPENQQHVVPENQGHGVPENQHGVPQNQQHGVPENQENVVPENQQHGVPENQEPGVPENQQHGVPGNQQHGVPENQQHGVPENQQHGVPENQQHGVPENQQHGVPENQENHQEDGVPEIQPDNLVSEKPEEYRLEIDCWNFPVAFKELSPNSIRLYRETDPPTEVTPLPKLKYTWYVEAPHVSSSKHQEMIKRAALAVCDCQSCTNPAGWVKISELPSYVPEVANIGYRLKLNVEADGYSNASRDVDTNTVVYPHGVPENQHGVPENQQHGVPENQEHGVPENQQHRVPENQQQGVPENQEHGVPENQQHGVPENQEHGVPENQQHGVPENQQHGVPENQQHGVPENQQHGVPENQQHGVPENQEHGVPENQQHGVPENQQHGVPENQQHGVPENQQHGVPENQQHGVPENQQHGVPENQEHGVPENQEHDVPENQQHGVPENQQHGVPENQQHGVPENQQHGVPENQQHGVPENQEHGVPENQQHGVPENQQHGQPLKNSMRNLIFRNSKDPNLKGEIRVLTYNVLSDWIATRANSGKQGQFFLEWENRKRSLLNEIVGHDADIICLQEVQENHFKNFFRSEFDDLGYSALYKRKKLYGVSVPSKANGPLESVQHGCATFYKRALFNETGRLEIEFFESAEELIKKLPEEQRLDAVNEIKKDNIAIVVILEKIVPKEEPFDGSQICVANTHIHYNEKDRTAKLFQVMDLINKLETFTPLEVPLLICGDFNSLPLSEPYHFITKGKLSTKDYLPPYLNYLKSEHSFGLKSAYSRMCHGPVKEEQLAKMDNKSEEPQFTTWTSDFHGTIDYIFYTDKRLKVVDLLELPSPEDVIPGIPSDNWPSDHIALMGVFVQDPTAKNSDKNESLLSSIGNSPIIKLPANWLNRKGCVVWITGFSGSGKSSVASAIWSILNHYGKRAYVLDEDLNVSFGHSFKAEGRAENIRRTGEHAKRIADSGDVCIVSFISPYKRDRDACRALLPAGHFIEVFMNIPLHECKARDPNGLYKLARAGMIKNLAGFDVPYELSSNCEIVLKSNRPFAMGEEVVLYLREKGFLQA